MSRPKKAVVDYFPHYTKHGKTMFTIENKYGNDGYAFWFKLLELIGATEQHLIDCRDIETWEYLLAITKVSNDIALEILDLLSRFNSIDGELWGHKIIWSEHFVQNINDVYKRREVKVYNKQDVLDKCIHKPHSKGQTVNRNPQSKVKYSKVKYSKVNNGSENKNTEIINWFDKKFWPIYPKRNGRRDGKKDALEWIKTNTKKEGVQDEILKGLKNYSNECGIDGELKYPVDAIRFLKRELWKDYLEEIKGTVTNGNKQRSFGKNRTNIQRSAASDGNPNRVDAVFSTGET